MAEENGKAKDRRSEQAADKYSGPERRVRPDRRKVPRRAGARRYTPRRLDERRSAGIGEVQDDRRSKDRRRDERRKKKRRNVDRGVPPPGRRKVDKD